jgi:hypothetical protein
MRSPLPFGPQMYGEVGVDEGDAELCEQVGDEEGLAAVALEGETDAPAGTLTFRAPALAEVEPTTLGAFVLGVFGDAAVDGRSSGRARSPETVAVSTLTAGV